MALVGETSLDLITDRTAADVSEARRLIAKRNAGVLSEVETLIYEAGLRGTYNYTDMNRVGAAIRYVADRLIGERYAVNVSPKINWTTNDVPHRSQWKHYLDDVKHLRGILTLSEQTPGITDEMYNGIGYEQANDIEKILVRLDIYITNMIKGYWYSGELYAGEV